MKVIRKGNHNNVFPMKIVCQQVVDKYGFTYGGDHDFCGSELEIEAEDIKSINGINIQIIVELIMEWCVLCVGNLLLLIPVKFLFGC